MADIAQDVQREFGVDVARELEVLQTHMVASREIYGAARTRLDALDGFGELLEFGTKKPDVKQISDEFQTVRRPMSAYSGLCTPGLPLAHSWRAHRCSHQPQLCIC